MTQDFIVDPASFLFTIIFFKVFHPFLSDPKDTIPFLLIFFLYRNLNPTNIPVRNNVL